MITVVIPVRNRATLVGRTLRSLAEQTLAPEAVVLVDNGSTDGTADVLHRWAAGRPGAVVVEEPQPGAARARNAGLALVKTPYVLFFDSDDVMPPRHIEQISAALTAEGMPDIGVFDMELINLDGSRSPKPFRRGDLMANHIFHAILATQRCVVSTRLIRRAGGWNVTLGGWDDLELGVRLLMQKPRAVYIPLDQPVQVYSQADSITGTDFSSKAGQWECSLDAMSAALQNTPYAKLIDYRRAILAGMYMREGRRELATPLLKSFKMKLIARYVALGGWGVSFIARIIG